jgi:hypothetical protein
MTIHKKDMVGAFVFLPLWNLNLYLRAQRWRVLPRGFGPQKNTPTWPCSRGCARANSPKILSKLGRP